MNKKKLAIAVTVITVVGGITGIATNVSGWLTPAKPPADLKLINARIAEGATERGEAIVLQVTNEGGQIAFVTAVEFRVDHVGVFALSGGVPSSATYDVRLPAGPTSELDGTVFSAPLSQRVDANDIDRFTINVGSASTSGSMMYDYQVTIRLVYNEGRRTGYSETLQLRVN